MWNPLKTEVRDRFTGVESYFKATRGLGKSFQQTSKGMAFVHVYAVYEFTVKSVFRTAIDQIMAHGLKVDKLTPSLLAIFLEPELQSFKTIGGKKASLEARTKIFERLFSNQPASVSNTIFPTDGSHFRQGQLQTVFNILGIRRMAAQRRAHLLRIDEVVGHRNAIAHGGETAAAIGSRYTRQEVLQIMRQMQSVCMLIVSAVEKQCSNKSKICRR
jgi:hypothetical protein